MKWTYSYSLPQPIYSSVSHLAINSTLNVLFVTSAHIVVRTTRFLINGTGSVTKAETFADSMTQYLIVKAAYIVDFNNLKLLFIGTIQTQTNQVILATVSLGGTTSTITYQRTL